MGEEIAPRLVAGRPSSPVDEPDLGRAEEAFHRRVVEAAVSVGLLLAFACVGVLIWFIHHVAASIGLDRVIDAGALANAAEACDAVLRLRVRPGDFVSPSTAVGDDPSVRAAVAERNARALSALGRPGREVHAPARPTRRRSPRPFPAPPGGPRRT